MADYLLALDFWAESLFIEFGRLPRRVGLDTFQPDIGQIRELAARYPHKIWQIGPQPGWFRHLDDAQIILFLIDFISYCRTISPSFADHPVFKPTNMLRLVLQNGVLDDASMANVIAWLVGLGATIEEKEWEAFCEEYPDRVQALHALSAAVPIDIKEPEH